jgi:cardiolipin synthase A/B
MRWVGRRGVTLLCMAGLTACSSLPRVLPNEMAESAGQLPAALPMLGAAGPLSAAQSAAVLQRLKNTAQLADVDTSIYARHLAREQAITGSPLTVGNQALLLQDGPATYAAMLMAINSAQDHIHMETYILDDDDVGQRFAQALAGKQAQGVQVRLIRDSVGTLGTPATFFQRLTDSGIEVLEFNPANPLVAGADWALNQRDHRKLLIVDGRIAILGGINISSVYSGGSSKTTARAQAVAPVHLAWRDTDLQLQGPVVAQLQRLFLETWAQQDKRAKAEDGSVPARNYFPAPVSAGREVVRAIGSSPTEPFSAIYATLLSAIASAQLSVHITNAYFAPDPQLLAALEAACARGVAVVLILPSQTDSWLVFHAGRSYYDRLLQAGVRIFERRGVVLHAKTALIDGVWATVGSTNLDWRSFLHNQELNAVVLGADFGRQVQATFDKDLAASNEVLLPQWRQRALSLRLKEVFSRVWEYWL